jgi:5-methyltetrahydropteroyltriglutamate--homocysteine methyltransferase
VKRSSQRVLTSHVGSLVRTPELVEDRILAYLGETPAEESSAETLRASVHDVVRHQADVGIDVIDDGEYGKLNWIAYVGDRVQGFEKIVMSAESLAGASFWPEQERFGEFYRRYERYETTQWLPDTPSLGRYTGNQMVDYRNLVCRSPLKYDPAPLRRDIENFKAALHSVEVSDAFMPVVAPGSIEIVPNEYYSTPDDYLEALCGVLHEEYRQIVDAGFIVQIDDAIVPAMYYYAFQGRPLAEYLRWAEKRIEAVNLALVGIPEEHVRYHICFGSQNIPHTTDPSLKDIIGLVLKVRAQAYSIEACNPAHEHEWEVWMDVRLPDGKILVPGVISHATNVIEHPKLIARRIARFANLVGRENVIASSDCGFSQGWNSPRVHSQIQWAKLEALVAGARLASDELWG